MKNCIKFKVILKFLKELNDIAGYLVFEKNEEKKFSLIRRFSHFNLMVFVVNLVSFISATLIFSNFDLKSIVVCGALVTANISILFNGLAMKFYNKQVRSILDWCQSLHNIKEKFHPVIRKTAETHLGFKIEKAFKTMKMICFLLYGDVFVITLGTVIVGAMLPERIYPKYSLPLPNVYPFSYKKNWYTFVLGVICQFKGALDSGTLVVFSFAINYCILQHVLTYLEVIIATICLMKEKMKMKIEPVEHSSENQVLDRQTLSEILKSFETNNNVDIASCLSFDDWIKIITQMICDVNDFISKFKKMFSGPLLLLELGSFGCLFISGMIILVVHQQYSIVVGAVSIPTLLLGVCSANEQILDKFSEIKDELYDLPWYTLSSKERKTLLIVLECDNIQNGFSAGKFHQMNNERFAKVLNTAYSNCLVLKDMIEK